MSDQPTREQLLKLVEELRETNQRLHRRVQAVESGEFAKPFLKETFRLKNAATMWASAWHSEFDRLGRAFDQARGYFEVAAKALGLPYGKYHSVNDCQLESGKDGVIRANVIHENKVQSFSILEVLTKLAEQASKNP